MRGDEELAGQIKQAMLDDHRLSQQAVEVSVRRGVVTLSGSVQSHRRKLVAQQIAASFDGCRDVVNELAVEPPGPICDEEVAANVRAALEVHADITKEVIAVSVTNGRVTLRGNVASNWEHMIAEDVALSGRGVRSVENLLVVDLVGQIEDESLSRTIQEALSVARGLSDAEVHVSVTGDLAVVYGQVRELWQKEVATEVVRRYRVRTIRNEIAVTG